MSTLHHARRLFELFAGAVAMLCVYVLSEGPARSLLVNSNIPGDSVLYTALCWAYQPVMESIEYLPAPIQEARESYLDWFAPFWMDDSFVHCD
jgi:hypothetical protein